MPRHSVTVHVHVYTRISHRQTLHEFPRQLCRTSNRAISRQVDNCSKGTCLAWRNMLKTYKVGNETRDRLHTGLAGACFKCPSQMPPSCRATLLRHRTATHCPMFSHDRPRQAAGYPIATEVRGAFTSSDSHPMTRLAGCSLWGAQCMPSVVIVHRRCTSCGKDH